MRQEHADREAMCAGKGAFLNWSSADEAAKRIQRRTREPMNVYRCSACGRWHVGARRTT